MSSPRAVQALALAGLLACLASPVSRAETLPLPAGQVALQSGEGQALLRGAEAATSYSLLSIHFTTQETATFCGPASLVMVLNAVGIPRPVRVKGEPYLLFNQDNLFTPGVRRIKSPAAVRRDGLTLEQLGQMLEAHGLQADVQRAGSTSLASFRTRAVQTLNSKNEFILVNYLRSELGQETGGHISPLAAYDADTDMFLILDVARYKYPPMWVSAQSLHAAMDTEAGAHTRGYVIARAAGHAGTGRVTLKTRAAF